MQKRTLIHLLFFASVAPSLAQVPPVPTAEQLRQIVRQVADSQVRYITHDGTYFRYQVHRVDPKEDTTRDLIESKDGSIARLLLKNGQSLTRDEDGDERKRLQKLLDSNDFGETHKDQLKSRQYAIDLVRAMPDAMLYTLTPGQPQLQNLDRPQIVLDYAPDPQFHPKTTAQGLLTGLAGRIWIDTADHHLVRLEVGAKRNLDLAMGILVRVYAGGTVELDQRRLAENQYAYTHVRMHLRLRELMLKTVPFESDLTATDIQPLPNPPSGADAVRALLNDPVKTR